MTKPTCRIKIVSDMGIYLVGYIKDHPLKPVRQTDPPEGRLMATSRVVRRNGATIETENIYYTVV